MNNLTDSRGWRGARAAKREERYISIKRDRKSQALGGARMTKDKEARLRVSYAHRVALCGRYATEASEAKVLERLCYRVQLRLSLWRLRRTSQVASLRADAYRVGPNERNKMCVAKA